MITFTVEFSGLTESIVGQKSISLQMPDGSTYRDLVRKLAHDYPDLVGILIAPDGENFLSSNMFVINGNLENAVMLLDQLLENGTTIHLMSVITGG